MNLRFRYLWGAFSLVFLAGVTPVCAQVYDHGDPTPQEQYELELINRARANPHAEGDLLFGTTDPYLLNNLQYWKSPTPSQVKADFYTYAAKPPLAFNKDLIAAARRHSQDMLDHNYQDHNSPTDGSTPFTRMSDAGYTYDFAGENIFAYGNDLDEINQEFEYDFGNPSLGHRENLINFGNFTYSEIGIGMIFGGSGSPNVGPIVTTEDFGHDPAQPTFITGVVYGDDNHNNFYDVGEGMAGVTITASNGWKAISSTSGGYAIPASGGGTITLTASGGPLTANISHTVSVSSDNVKVDFIQGSTGFPDKPILLAPVADTSINTDTAHFTWLKSTGETKYWIQVATDPRMTKIILKDTSLSTNSRIFPKAGSTEKNLTDGTTYYWQVKSKNTIGWGQFSPVDSFVVALPPKQVVMLSPADKANTGTSDITLTWKNTIPPANDYWIEISKSPTFNTIDVKSDTLYPDPDTTVTYAFADFEAQRTYYWRLRAQNDNGWSQPSVVRSFTTGGVNSVAQGNSSSFSVSVTPNPTRGETHLLFSIKQTADVLLKVFDLSGAEVTNINLGKLSPSRYEINWDGKNVPSGVYQYELIAGDERVTGRIIVTR